MAEILLPIHLGALSVAAIVVMFADKEAFLWMRGNKSLLDLGRMRLIHYLMWAALLTMITSGVLMAWPDRGVLIFYPPFLLKMAFVAALVINAFVIGRFLRTPTERNYASLSRSEKMPLFLSGAVSFVSWFGA